MPPVHISPPSFPGCVRFWLSAGRGGFGLSATECLGSTLYVMVLAKAERSEEEETGAPSPCHCHAAVAAALGPLCCGGAIPSHSWDPSEPTPTTAATAATSASQSTCVAGASRRRPSRSNHLTLPLSKCAEPGAGVGKVAWSGGDRHARDGARPPACVPSMPLVRHIAVHPQMLPTLATAPPRSPPTTCPTRWL